LKKLRVFPDIFREICAMSEIIIYAPTDGGSVTVRLEGESLWLTQEQMAELFGRERSVITKHLRNVFRESELVESSACANFAHTAGDGKTYQTRHYNLDAIISVGYRVNSKRGTQFRQWATSILRDHLLQGWTLDRARFERNAQELEAALALVRKTAQSPNLIAETGRGLVEIVSRYTQTFLLLQRYDEGLLTDPNGTAGGVMLTLAEVRQSIASLKADRNCLSCSRIGWQRQLTPIDRFLWHRLKIESSQAANIHGPSCKWRCLCSCARIWGDRRSGPPKREYAADRAKIVLSGTGAPLIQAQCR
jgi:Virulence protein RhuM family